MRKIYASCVRTVTLVKLRHDMILNPLGHTTRYELVPAYIGVEELVSRPSHCLPATLGLPLLLAKCFSGIRVSNSPGFNQQDSGTVFILALRFGGESPKSAAEGGFKPTTFFCCKIPL